MHEKKTVVREESTQNDALLAIFFSCLVHETLTLFCILALKKNYTDNKQKLHRYTDGWGYYADYSPSIWSAVIDFTQTENLLCVCVCVCVSVRCHELELLNKYHELEEFETICFENSVKIKFNVKEGG